jgi:DNA mismatch endonuclease Vsr
MPDVFTKRKRSEVMSRIRGKGNKDTELALAKLFRASHISGWRRNQRLIGKPDFVFPKQRVAVFVDGCFWHGCPKHSSPARWLRKSSMAAEGDSRRWGSKSGARRQEPEGENRARGGGKKMTLSATRERGRGSTGVSPSRAAVRTGKRFWAGKMAGNMARDRWVTRALRRRGWRVVRIWEHELGEGKRATTEILRKLRMTRRWGN